MEEQQQERRGGGKQPVRSRSGPLRFSVGSRFRCSQNGSQQTGHIHGFWFPRLAEPGRPPNEHRGPGRPFRVVQGQAVRVSGRLVEGPVDDGHSTGDPRASPGHMPLGCIQSGSGMAPRRDWIADRAASGRSRRFATLSQKVRGNLLFGILF